MSNLLYQFGVDEVEDLMILLSTNVKRNKNRQRGRNVFENSI